MFCNVFLSEAPRICQLTTTVAVKNSLTSLKIIFCLQRHLRECQILYMHGGLSKEATQRAVILRNSRWRISYGLFFCRQYRTQAAEPNLKLVI